MKTTIAALVCALLVAGCGAAGSDPSTAEFVEACMGAVNWEQPMCACMAEKAESELSTTARAFIVASLEDDEARTEKLRGELSIAEAVKAGMFMTQAGSCAGS